MVVDLGICGLISLGIGCLIGVSCRKRRVVVRKENPAFAGYDLNDVLRLIEANNATVINGLFSEYQVNKEMPEFYGKYVHLSRRARDRRYAVLLELLERMKTPQVSQGVEELKLSLQDRLLLEMYNMGVSNKVIAQVLGVNVDTLKKRKTRLKMKVNELVVAEDVLPLRQSVSV